jgi:hypothetical protein
MPTPRTKPGAKLDRARQEFDSLLAQVAEARATHARWEASAERLRELGRRVLDSLEEQFNVYARQLIQVFDQAYAHTTLNDPERSAIAESICTLANRVLTWADDSDIKHVYNRYSGSDYESDRSRFGTQLREIGDMLLADTYPERCAWDPEAEQEQAEELHAKLVGIILTLPAGQQPALLEQANAGYVNGDALTLQMLEIELDQIRRPGAGHLRIRQLEKRIDLMGAYLDELEFATMGIQFSLMVRLNLPGTPELTEHIARHCVHLQKHALEYQLENIACDVADFRDIAKLKAWIKEKQQHTGQAAPVHH